MAYLESGGTQREPPMPITSERPAPNVCFIYSFVFVPCIGGEQVYDRTVRNPSNCTFLVNVLFV